MLTGTIPVDLALVGNLKILYLNENRFSGEIPAVFSTFHRLNVLNLANNNLTGPIPTAVCAMPVRDLILQDNQLSGDIPDNVMATNFNVSNNNLSGPIPPNLAAKYMSTSFEGNLYLCGKPLNTSCSSQNASAPARTAFPSGAKSPSSGTNETSSALPPMANSNKGGLSTDKIAAIVVCSVVVLIVVTFMAFVIYWRSKYGTSGEEKPKRKRKLSSGSCSGHFSGSFSTQFSGQLPGQFSAQVAPEGEEGSTRVCNLILFEGDDKAFGLEDLLRASAQMLGKGSIGTAYKVTLEGGHSVAVKRLRNMKNMSRKNFEHQLEVIRKLVHPNVAPLRAYYHTPEEKLLVFDYYPNGNLFSILHCWFALPLLPNLKTPAHDQYFQYACDSGVVLEPIVCCEALFSLILLLLFLAKDHEKGIETSFAVGTCARLALVFLWTYGVLLGDMLGGVLVGRV